MKDLVKYSKIAEGRAEARAEKLRVVNVSSPEALKVCIHMNFTKISSNII